MPLHRTDWVQLGRGACVRAWAGSGSISKLEFRVNVRKLVDRDGYKADLAEIDTLFEELDVDRGGGISMVELKHALKTLKDKTVEATERAAALGESADDFRRLAVHTKQVARITRLTEQAVAQLDAATEASKSLVRDSNDTKHSGVGSRSLNAKMAPAPSTDTSSAGGSAAGAQLGALMVRRGLDAEKVLASWDTSGDGVIDADEVCATDCSGEPLPFGSPRAD